MCLKMHMRIGMHMPMDGYPCLPMDGHPALPNPCREANLTDPIYGWLSLPSPMGKVETLPMIIFAHKEGGFKPHYLG